MRSPHAFRRLAAAGCLLAHLALFAGAETLPLPPHQIALDTPAGQALLRGAEAFADYGPLSIHFTTQETATFCGPASLAMVLNASGIARPVRRKGEPFRLFNQDNIFTPSVRSLKSPNKVRRDGLTLDQLGQMFEIHGLRTETVRADSVTLDQFRARAASALNSENEFIVVNYLRSALAQETGGHISPLAAYNADTDMFLILDVARYKYPPMWVTAAELHASMDTRAGPVSRGYVVARVPTRQSAVAARVRF